MKQILKLKLLNESIICKSTQRWILVNVKIWRKVQSSSEPLLVIALCSVFNDFLESKKKRRKNYRCPEGTSVQPRRPLFPLLLFWKKNENIWNNGHFNRKRKVISFQCVWVCTCVSVTANQRALTGLYIFLFFFKRPWNQIYFRGSL